MVFPLFETKNILMGHLSQLPVLRLANKNNVLDGILAGKW